MKKALLWLFLLLSVLVFAAYVERGPLAMKMMQKVLDERMGRDAISGLPDGLHVVLCGAGSPLPDPRRSGACVAVAAGESLFVVDAGTNGARNLSRMGINPGQINAILLSHFHSDHIDGLGELMLLRWTSGSRHQPVPVLGPQGVEQVVSGFNEAYAQDARYRTAHHGETVAPSGGTGGSAMPFVEPEIGQLLKIWDEDGVVISVFRVDHRPVAPAVGYRFDYAGRSVVISGDTARSPNLEKFSEGVDLLVHEALSPELVGVLHEAAVNNARTGIAEITEDILSYHTTPVEVADIAAAAGVRHLLFYHVIPPLLVPGIDQIFLRGVADTYEGPVTLGIDGTWIALPAASKAIQVDQFPGLF